MGLLDATLDASFAIDSEGRRVFYPNGPFRRGLVIPGEAEYERLRATNLRFYQIRGVVIVMFALVVTPRRSSAVQATLALFAVGVPFILVWEIWLRRVTSGWQRCAPHRRVFRRG